MSKEKVVHINVPKFGQILTVRPANMDYEQYRAERAYQCKRLKARLKGFVVHKASEIIKIGENQIYRKYEPCVGKTFKLNFQ